MLSEKARMRLGVPKLPLEDVLDAVIRTEAEPGFQGVSRWCRRYPEYKEALTDFFAKWETANVEAEMHHPEELTITTVKRVLAGMRREGGIPPEDDAAPLELFDRLVLDGVSELAGKGHCENITKRLTESAGTCVLPASTAAVLASLENRDLIWSRVARRKADPEHKPRQYFTITLAGKRALRSGK